MVFTIPTKIKFQLGGLGLNVPPVDFEFSSPVYHGMLMEKHLYCCSPPLMLDPGSWILVPRGCTRWNFMKKSGDVKHSPDETSSCGSSPVRFRLMKSQLSLILNFMTMGSVQVWNGCVPNWFHECIFCWLGLRPSLEFG